VPDTLRKIALSLKLGAPPMLAGLGGVLALPMELNRR